ncbi:hypothetical protein ACH5RR_024850, partial [Cinchona calisaya]
VESEAKNPEMTKTENTKAREKELKKLMAAQKAEAARLQAQQSSNSSKAGKKKNFTGEGLEDNAGDYVYRETVLGGMLGGKSQISLLHMPAGLSRLLRLIPLFTGVEMVSRRIPLFTGVECLDLVPYSISKKYDIDKKRDSIVSGDDSFTCLYATVESDIEATIVNLLFVQWMFLFDHQTDGDVAFACLDAAVESDIEAALQSLKLSVVEEIRLDDEVDNIEKTLSVALLDGKGGASTNKSLGSLLVSKYLDDTAFENQSALFALAVSDIVPINMFHDIGRQQAANKLLVKTVFRALLENLEPVLREELKPVLREDIQKVEVVALSSFEEKEEQFKEQVLVWNNSSGFLWEAVPVLYDVEATYFDEGVRTGKRKQLEEKLLQLVQPAFQLMLGHIWSGTLERFKEAFNDALNGGKGFAITARRCTETSISQLEEWLSQRQKKKLGGFSALFSHDTDSMLRVWTWKEDIRAITKTARSSALKLLSVMEAIHLDDVVDNIEKTLSLVLLDSKGGASTNKNLIS